MCKVMLDVYRTVVLLVIELYLLEVPLWNSRLRYCSWWVWLKRGSIAASVREPECLWHPDTWREYSRGFILTEGGLTTWFSRVVSC